MEKDQEKLNKLEKRLYQKSADLSTRKTRIKSSTNKFNRDWIEKKENRKINYGAIGRKHYNSRLLYKLLIASAIFFVFASSIAVYRIFVSPNLVSSRNIDIIIGGPVSVGGGEELTLQVLITNKNKVQLEATELIIEYPEGTRSLETLQPLTRERISLGAIFPNEPVTRTFKVILFGEENTDKDIKFKLEYRAEGSSGTFLKEKVYSVEISNSPTTLSVNIPPEVNSGQRMDIVINAKSNSTSIIEDFMVAIEYPFGYEFQSSIPEPSFDNNVWYIGDLPPSKEIEIKMVGSITGQVAGQRSFKISTGVQDEDDARSFGVVYNTLTEIIDIERPFIGIDFLLNGIDADSVSTRSGRLIVGEIVWVNNLPTRILNGKFEVKLEGAILDESKVSPSKGFYRSLDNTMIWDQITDRTLETLEPGERGTVRFTLIPFSLLGQSGATYRKPTINLTLTFTGTRVSEGFSGDPIELVSEKVIKITTETQLASYGLLHSGPFVNTGPIPPRVDQETTYTIVWSITNSSNDISETKVTANIPTYVRFLGNLSPQDENITYNDITGEIVWNVGRVPAGVGLTNSPQQVFFQLGFTPSISQLNESPNLISEATLEAIDSFTKDVITSTRPSIGINLNNDPDFNNATEGRVAE